MERRCWTGWMTVPGGVRRAAAAVGAAALLLGSGACPGGEEPLLVDVPVEAGSARGATFTTALGYDIALDDAVIVLGALQFHEPKSAEELGLVAPWQRPLRAVMGPAVARAHPGHDMSGDVKGEWTGMTYIDLLAAPVALGDAPFYEGEYETASLSLMQDGVDGDSGLDASSPGAGHTLALAGTADDGDGPIPFVFVVDHDEAIQGIPFVTTIGADALPTVTLLVDPAEILSHLEFSELDGDGDGTVTTEDEDVINPLVFGLESSLAYAFTIDPA